MNRHEKNSRDGRLDKEQAGSSLGGGAPKVWRDVCDRLRHIVGPEDYGKWIADLRFIAEVDGEVLIAARDGFATARIDQDFKSHIKRTWAAVDPKQRRVKIAVWKSLPADVRALVEEPWADAPRPVPVASESDVAVPAPTVSSTQTFETLVVGPSNRGAVSIIKRIADGEEPTPPIVFIVGCQGVGKTHLIQALLNESAARKDARRITYMQAEEFMSAYVAGAKAGDTADLKARIRKSDIVAIDDLQAIKGKEKTEKEFFANIRSAIASGGQVILTADETPGDFQGLSARLRNELQGAACAEIQLPDEEMREAILRKHAGLIAQSDPNFLLSDEMVAQILKRVRGPGRNLCGVLWSLQIESEFGEKDITMDMLEHVIRRSEGDRKDPTIDQIKRATSSSFGITKANMESASKARIYCYPRQVAMYLCRTMTDKSFPQIAKCFGNRDHTTVLHAFKKITGDMEKNADVARDISRVSDAVYDLQISSAR